MDGPAAPAHGEVTVLGRVDEGLRRLHGTAQSRLHRAHRLTGAQTETMGTDSGNRRRGASGAGRYWVPERDNVHYKRHQITDSAVIYNDRVWFLPNYVYNFT